MKIVENLSHAPCEAALQWFCLFSLAYGRICPDPISLFKIISALLEIPRQLTFAPPTSQGRRRIHEKTPDKIMLEYNKRRLYTLICPPDSTM